MKLHPAIAGVVVLVVGIGIVGFGVYLAYNAYETYRPVLPRASSLDEAITNTAYELINLVLKLGFLGVMIWGGGIMIKHGSGLLVEGYRVDRGADKCSGQQKQGS